MYHFLARIYHLLSDIPLVRACGEKYLQGFSLGNKLAVRRLKKQSLQRRSDHTPIRVLFILQFLTDWKNVRSVFEAMRNGHRFDANVLCVRDTLEGTGDEAFSQMRERYGEVVFSAEAEGDSPTDPASFRPDYVFYLRPYDRYLPARCHSEVVSSCARIVYIPYGFGLFHTVESHGYNGRFFRNVALFFADNTYAEHLQKTRYAETHATGLQKTFCLGYPALAEYTDLNKTSWLDKFTIAWTPRYTDEEELGGSSFLAYKDPLQHYIETHDDTAWIFRPHPFLFQHFKKNGKITEEEIEAYRCRIEENGRMHYDDDQDFKRTFSDADVLLSDMSAILSFWIVTGKPLIYHDTGAEFNACFASLKEGMYCTGSWEETEGILDMLRRGEDPLKEEREKLCSQALLTPDKDIVSQILEEIEKDYWQKHF